MTFTFTEWRNELAARLAAAAAATRELAEHLRQLPTPTDDADAEELIAWRQARGYSSGPADIAYHATSGEQLLMPVATAVSDAHRAAREAMINAEAVLAGLAEAGCQAVIRVADFGGGARESGGGGMVLGLVGALPPGHFARQLVRVADLFPSLYGSALLLGVAPGPWVPSRVAVTLTLEAAARGRAEAERYQAERAREAEAGARETRWLREARELEVANHALAALRQRGPF